MVNAQSSHTPRDGGEVRLAVSLHRGRGRTGRLAVFLTLAMSSAVVVAGALVARLTSLTTVEACFVIVLPGLTLAVLAGALMWAGTEHRGVQLPTPAGRRAQIRARPPLAGQHVGRARPVHSGSGER